MMSKLNVISFAFILFANNLSALSVDDTLFNDTVLHEIRIEFDYVDYWDSLLSKVDPGSVFAVPAIQNKTNIKAAYKNRVMAEIDAPDDDKIDYVHADISIDGNVLNNVGIRFKGFTSYSSSLYKKPFRIDLNEFNDTLNYFGIKKFCLNNGTGDPSLQREAICYGLLRKAGVAAPRTSYAKLYLNGVYWGIYLLVEQIDKTFLENNFASGKGNLYKAMGNYDFSYTTDNFKDYIHQFTLRTNENIADGKDFIRLVKTISRYSGKQFSDSIQKIFYVDYFLRTLAIDVITKNWDSYMEHGRNFYLYNEPVSGLFYWIPWDYNFALESGFTGGVTDTNSCGLNFQFTYDTLGTNAIFKFSFNRNEFNSLWAFFGDNTDHYFLESSMINDTADYITTEYSHVYEKRGIYPVNIYITANNENCYISTTERITLIDTTGICPTAFKMQNAYIPDEALAQFLAIEPFCCDCQWDNICLNKLEKFEYQTHIDDQMYPINYFTSRLLVSRLFSDAEFKKRYLDIFKFILDSVYNMDEINKKIYSNADLIRNEVYNDTNYLFSTIDFENEISAECDKDISEWGISSLSRVMQNRKPGLLEEYQSLNHTTEPIDKPVNYNDVVVNEIAASVTDENGDSKSDWIELYNNTNKIVSLKNMSVSDDYQDPEKFNFRDNSAISPDGYLIIWADTKTKKDGYHAGFKLSASGEEVFLFHKQFGTIDTIQFGPQEENVTFSRFPNGTGPFIPMKPTFNRRNLETSGIYEQLTEDLGIGLLVYPNPFNDILTCISINSTEKYILTVYTTLGQPIIIDELTNGMTKIDLTNLNSGMYIIEIKTEHKQFKRIVIKE